MKQLELFTGLGRPWSPANEVRDLRIMILDALARQWYGELQQIDVECNCGAKLYFWWNYLSAYNNEVLDDAVVYCRNCGYWREVNLDE